VTDAGGVTTTSSINATMSDAGNWTVNYGPVNGTITKASLVSLIDGDLYNNGGQDSVTFLTSVNMQSLTIAQDPVRTFSARDNNDGFQIEYIGVNPGSNGQSYTYPIDFWAAIQDNTGEAEAFTGLILSDLPSGTIVSVRLNDGSFDEITPNTQGEFDLSAYTSLLNSPTTISGTDKVYLVTNLPLLTGFAPTLALEVADGSSVAKTIIGGTYSSILVGGDGNDYIDGGAGNDTLIGGEGDDILLGGSGADTFVWQAGHFGNDVIKDFNIGQGDLIDLSELLQGESAGTIDHFLKLVTENGTSTLLISSTGQFDGTDTGAVTAGKVDVTIELSGANLSGYDISALIGTTDTSTIKID
jgi:Ca2+-binding RTX toxin-like protein